MKPTLKRFRIRRADADQPPQAGADAKAPAQDAPAQAADPTPSAAEVDAIRSEALSARQLRMARRVAQKHGIEASSDMDAVRQLRRAGIDPFKRATMLDLVSSEATALGDDGLTANLPATRPADPPTPSTHRAPPSPPGGELSEIREIQQDIARRRKRRIGLLAARLSVFVLLPTLLVGWFYFTVATPLYTTESEFVIQQAESSGAQAGGLGGLFTGTALGSSQDSVTVQSYLQSRDAMLRLDREHGFRAHFSAEGLDPLLRLEPGGTAEAAYRLYRRVVKIGFDPTEGLVRLEVRATDPDISATFSRALISYAEEQVDQMTQRLREDQMAGARTGFDEAELRMQEARERVIDLQESYAILSSDVEVSLLTTQMTTLQTELTRERLSLQELMANPRPNPARVDPLERRIANLQTEIASLRARLTEGNAEGVSLARISSELVMAEADVQTRQMLMSQALQQLEAARIEANRQVRYLSLGVPPVTPDEASHPRALENTLLAFLAFAGMYLMVAMTGAILREQISA